MITNYLDCPRCMYLNRNTEVGIFELRKIEEDEQTAEFRCSICGSTFTWVKKRRM